MATFAYSLLLRADEVTHISCAHIAEVEEGLKILIPTSKTDVMRGGQFIFLSKENTLLTDLFWRYLEKGNLTLEHNNFLFPKLRFDTHTKELRVTNEMLTYDKYRNVIRKHMDNLGLDKALFGTHSCRSGGATTLAAQADQYQLMLSGRWRDPRSLGSYVAVEDSKRLETSKLFNL